MTTQVETIVIKVREDGSRVVSRSFNTMANEGDRATATFNKMKAAIAGVVTGVVINQIRQLLDAYTQIQNRLRLTTTDQGNLNAVFNELVEISGRTRSSLEANTELYSKLSIASKDLGVSQKEVLQFTESVNKAIKISGATATEAEGGLRQLAQGLASGTLRGDELNSVLENLPAVADVIAKSLGITRGELRKMGADGKITGDIILKAFREAREELDEKFKQTVPTISEQFVGLKNQLLVTVGAIDQATGSSTLFAEGLGFVTTFVKDLTPELIGMARAITGNLDPMDEMSTGAKLLASVLIAVWGALKAVTSLISGVVLIAFRTVGKVIGGVVAAIQQVLAGDFNQAFETVKEAGSDIATSFAEDSNAAFNGATEATSQMFEKLDQIWDKGSRQIQDRRSAIVGEISDKTGPRRVSTGIDEKAVLKEQRALEKLRNELTAVLNQVAPLEGAQLELTDATLVLVKAQEKGIITSEQEIKFLEALITKYTDILDPLGKLNRELDQEAKLLGMTSRERAVESQVLESTKSLLEEGVVLTQAEVTALRQKFIALQAVNEATAAQDALLEGSVEKRRAFVTQMEAINKLLSDPTSGFGKGDAAQATIDSISSLGLDPTGLQVQQDAIVNQAQSMYDQIAVMRENNRISEQEAAALELQVWTQMQAQRLQGATTFLSNLSQLQNSKSKTAARIGKSAAIAQATIETYKSATSAYSAMAGIPYIGPALGIAAAAAAIAAGLENVRAIKAQPVGGYMSGGYTGNIPTNAVAGVVHGQEHVMDASSTRRLGVGNLEALRRGDAQISRGSQQQGGMWPPIKVNIENYGTSKEFEVQQLSPEDVRIIARDESSRVVQKETPKIVAAQVSDPNSRISKSLGKNTSTERRR